MINPIFSEYIKLVKIHINEYIKLIFEKKYNKDVYNRYIETYINTRYFNFAQVSSQTVFSRRILEELKNTKTMIGLDFPEDDTIINQMYIAFNFILRFDGVIRTKPTNYVIDELYNAMLRTFHFEERENFKDELFNLIRQSKMEEKQFLRKYNTDEFLLRLSKYDNKPFILRVNIKPNFTMPKVYSQYAIDKVFNSGIINEDKLQIEYCLIATHIINEIIDGDLKKQYILEFAETLLLKEGKLNRVLRIISDSVIQEKTSLKIKYSAFLKNKEKIYELRRSGFRIAVVLDETFEPDFENIELLEIFEFILVNENSSAFDKIVKNKSIITNIIKI